MTRHWEAEAIEAAGALTIANEEIRRLKTWSESLERALASCADQRDALQVELSRARVRISNQDYMLANKRANLEARTADLAALRAQVDSDIRAIREVAGT